MKFFKPEDFYELELPDIRNQMVVSAAAANLANAKLEREGKVVYRRNIGLCAESWTTGEHDANVPTHKALLINIEPIEKCTHPEEKAQWAPDVIGETSFWCECGAKLKPKTFEEVK